MQKTIQAQGLTRYYGEFKAVENINFSLNQGEICAFLGPNGAGKSTIMKMLTGFIAPTRGNSYICDVNMQNTRQVGATKLGYLPENGPLYLEMTPLECLQFSGGIHGMKGAKLAQEIFRVIDLCHLEEVMHKPCGKLSRGFRQRVGIAQALLHDPEVLILDEPCSGLDPVQVANLSAMLKHLAKHKTILLSTHIMNEVVTMCDRVLFINEGQLHFDGDVDKFIHQYGSAEEAFRSRTAATLNQ